MTSIWHYLRRCVVMLPAVPLCAFGVCLFLKADMGCDPLTSFELGLAAVLSIPLGTASLLFEGVVFAVFLFFDRSRLNFGSAAFCFGIGPCINLFSVIVDRMLPMPLSWLGRALCLLGGTLLICSGLAYYLPMDLGAQASDLLSLAVADRMRISYGTGLTIVYAVLMVLALLLGAPWGVGTVVATGCFGMIVNQMLRYTRSFSLRLAGVEINEAGGQST